LGYLGLKIFSRVLHLVVLFAYLNLSVFPVWGGLGDEADYTVSVSRHVSKQRTALGESLHIDITFKAKKDDVFKGENRFQIVRPLFCMDDKLSETLAYSGITEVFDCRKRLTPAERTFLSHVPQFKALSFKTTGALLVKGLKDTKHTYSFTSDGEISFEDSTLKEVFLGARSVNIRGNTVIGRLFSNLQDSRGSFQIFLGASLDLVSGKFLKGTFLNRGSLTSRRDQTLDFQDTSFFNEGDITSKHEVDLQNVKRFENHGNVTVLSFKVRGREFQNHSQIKAITLDVMCFQGVRNVGAMEGESLRVVSLGDFYNSGKITGTRAQKIITQRDFVNAETGVLEALDLQVEAFGKFTNLGKMRGQKSKILGRRRFQNRGKISGETLALTSLVSFVEDGEIEGVNVQVVSPESEFQEGSTVKAEVFTLETKTGGMFGNVTATKFVGDISKTLDVHESAVFALENWTLKGNGACIYKGRTANVSLLVFEGFGAFINEEGLKIGSIKGECGSFINLRDLETGRFSLRLKTLKNEGALKGGGGLYLQTGENHGRFGSDTFTLEVGEIFKNTGEVDVITLLGEGTFENLGTFRGGRNTTISGGDGHKDLW
jgi:hypothetical protein